LIGTKLELAEWRQGSIVKQDDAIQILNQIHNTLGKDVVLIVASQSCDIANNRIDLDPTIEFSIGQIKEQSNSTLRFNQNPRTLHIELLSVNTASQPTTRLSVELIAHRKITIEKIILERMKPDPTRGMPQSELDSYVRWLAGRYDRPAFPSEFNRRLESTRDKVRQKAKKANPALLGLYIELSPITELAQNETYTVNLLALTSDRASSPEDIQNVSALINVIETTMKSNNIEVKSRIASAEEISVAVFMRFKRLQYDFISLRENTPLPPTVA
jgi:hypothetical protein